MPIVITTVDEYEAAIQRAQELMGMTEGSAEEAELAEISDAIEAWDAKHDDATGWKE